MRPCKVITLKISKLHQINSLPDILCLLLYRRWVAVVDITSSSVFRAADLVAVAHVMGVRTGVGSGLLCYVVFAADLLGVRRQRVVPTSSTR